METQIRNSSTTQREQIFNAMDLLASKEETAKSYETCVNCALLWNMLTQPEFWYEFDGLERFLKPHCPSHSPIFQLIQRELSAETKLRLPDTNQAQDVDQQDERANHSSHKTSGRGPGFGKVSLQRSELDPHAYVCVRNSRKGSIAWPLLLALPKEYDNKPMTVCYGRVLDQRWVDLDLAKRWKHDCLKRHGNRCHNPLGIARVSPAWLIDTIEECLVPASNIPEYIALSYRWSKTTPFRNTRRALEGLRKPGALSSENLAVDLSPTVRHAIKLTSTLEERYLWVDVICIVQDDEKHLHEQLQLMGAIYSSAKLTIVASDGNAADGIVGLKGISPPRDLMQDVATAFDTFNIVLRSGPLLANIEGSTEYFQRGWTFQEYYLSKRRLIFVNQDIHWQCACAEWHEDLVQPQDAPQYHGEMARDLPNLLTAGAPNYGLLTKYLSEYNRRALSFPEDALSGISGFLAVLGQSYQGGFLFGLPTACFDSALLWEVASAKSGNGLHRRKAATNSVSASSSGLLPSWSWIGWMSDGLRFSEEETFELGNDAIRTVPITRWYTHETPFSSPKIPVDAYWHRLREIKTDASFVLPNDWTREEYNETTHRPARGYFADRQPPEGLGKYVYHHLKRPGKYFWLPIPINDTDERVQESVFSQTPYISCHTKRGWFHVTQGLRTETHPLTADIRNGELDVCGELMLHCKNDMAHFPAPHSETLFKAELVGICLRKSRIDLPMTKDRIHVLQVEWDNGVAHRKASGWVSRDAWEAHQLEDVYLVLG